MIKGGCWGVINASDYFVIREVCQIAEKGLRLALDSWE